MSDTVLFFVYGTLKEGGHFASGFDAFRQKSVEATLNNHALYNLGWFPTIREEEDSTVQGELHEYVNPDIVTKAMDRIEGFNGDPRSSLFVRKKVAVVTEEGEEIEANAYVLSRDLPANAKKIEDGVWALSGTQNS